MSAPLTFLFTDLEDSTLLWEQAPDAMRKALALHDRLVDRAVEGRHGRVVKGTGDGFLAAFESPADAVGAALDVQEAMSSTVWPEATGPLKVRIGLHTGESEERDGDFYGRTLNRAARVMGIANGGQILISGTTRSLVDGYLGPDMSLLDLGEHRLKGVETPVGLYQVCHPSLVAEFPPLQSLSTLKHNLPARQSAFIGREQEISDLQDQLRGTRLLTLLGAGGVGKTTLMLRLAEELVEVYPDGVWLIELATAADPDTIPDRIAATLGVPEHPGRPMRDAVSDYLRNKEVLVLLDNVEHLVAGAADLADHLLQRCPSLNLLATSREPLLIAGESVHRVPSLELPDPGDGLEAVASSEAAQLFVERARLVRADFELTHENAAPVAEIVRQLDGIPLALELAAARLRVLKVERIAARLSDRFRLLTGGGRTAVPRQQTLEAAIDWSWNLLDDAERTLLTRLSVFSGGWSLEAAAAVAGDAALDEFDVLDLIERLVDKSLVTAEFNKAGEARYGMLESIRQYSSDRLAAAGGGADLRRKHAEHFTGLAETASPHLVRTDVMQWVERIVLDLDNLRAAVAWANEHDVAMSLRLGGSLLEYEVVWLTPRESKAWIEPAIEKARELMQRDPDSVPRGDFLRALMALGMVQGMSGDRLASARTFDECIELAEQADETRVLAHATAMKIPQVRFELEPETELAVDRAIELARGRGHDVELAWLLWARGWLASGDERLRSYGEAAELFASFGNPLFDVLAERMQFESHVIRGDYEEAKRVGLAWVQRAKVAGSRRVITQSTSELAHLLRRNGDFEEAEGLYRDAIVMWQELGHESAVAHQLECLAYVAIARGQPEHAAPLLGASTEARRRLDAASQDPREVAELTEARDQLASELGEGVRDEMMSSGMRLSMDDAVHMAVTGP